MSPKSCSVRPPSQFPPLIYPPLTTSSNALALPLLPSNPATHPRIASLRNPLTKMSKSDPAPAAKILLTDPAALIHSKFKTALTDSLPSVTYDPVARPGIAGLLQIHSGYSGETVEALAGRFARGGGVRELKESCAEVVDGALKGFRGEYERMRREEGWLEEREKEGARRAQERAREVMREVKKAVGTD